MKNKILFIPLVVVVIALFSMSALSLRTVSVSVEDFQDALPVALNQKVLEVDGEAMVIDYSTNTVSFKGVDAPILNDALEYPEGEEGQGAILGAESFTHKIYYNPDSSIALDVFIEDTFYNANTVALDDFWDKFFPRFEILKERTGWSSQKWFGVPLEIYVYGHSAACYGGNASPTHSNVVFSDPMYKTGCNKPSYDVFNGSTSYGNTGELGDWWPYMNTALHESTHSIMPYPIYTRSWLTEGWAEYEMYNTLTEVVPGNTVSDINHATADTYLYKGFAGYQWYPYVANDFHDTTVYNRELQRSHGYDLTGYLFTKMRDEENMDWDEFYRLMNNNKESLDRTFSLPAPYIYYTDAFVINVFGKAMGHTNYWTETDPMWNYYSTPGHGYGARNISSPYNDFTWFADYQSDIAVSDYAPEVDDIITITATVYNQGDVNAKNIGIRLYADDVLLHEEYLDINKFQNKQVVTTYTVVAGDQDIEVRVDEGNFKIELSDANNDDSIVLSGVYAPTAPDLQPFSPIVRNEMSTVYIYPIATDLNEDAITYTIDSLAFIWDETFNRFKWQTGPRDSGEYSFTVTASDGALEDSEVVDVTVNNKCTSFDKRNMCWVGCTCKFTDIDAPAIKMLK